MRVSASPNSPPAAPANVAAPETDGRTFTAVLGDRTGPVPASTGSLARAGHAWPSPVTSALVRLGDSQQAVDRLLTAAARGQTFTPSQLLALQATVSRDAQTVEVVSRAADRVVGALKQALGAQI